MREKEPVLEQLTGAIAIGHTLFDRCSRPIKDTFGIRCGMDELDMTLKGFTQGKLYTIGGRPGSGKTSFGTSITAGVMKQDNSVPVVYISTELSRVEIMEQIVESYAGVPFYLKHRCHTLDETKKIQTAISLLQLQLNLNLLGVVHYKRISVPIISEVIDTHCEICGSTSLVIIDQASRMDRDEKSGYTIGTEKMLNSLEEMADDQDVPVILFSQLNRGANGVRPTMADYKWSGAFEEYSHAALLLWREELIDGKYYPWTSKIIVDKNRSGTTKEIEAIFMGECHKWEESTSYLGRCGTGQHWGSQGASHD